LLRQILINSYLVRREWQTKRGAEKKPEANAWADRTEKRISKDQYVWLKSAIENWRNVQQSLKLMENISLTMLFKTVPDTHRRKPLSKKVMGIN